MIMSDNTQVVIGFFTAVVHPYLRQPKHVRTLGTSELTSE